MFNHSLAELFVLQVAKILNMTSCWARKSQNSEFKDVTLAKQDLTKTQFSFAKGRKMSAS